MTTHFNTSMADKLNATFTSDSLRVRQNRPLMVQPVQSVQTVKPLQTVTPVQTAPMSQSHLPPALPPVAVQRLLNPPTSPVRKDRNDSRTISTTVDDDTWEKAEELRYKFNIAIGPMIRHAVKEAITRRWERELKSELAA